MKHAIRILIALLLCLCICTALADTYYVKSGTPLSLRDENTNEVLTTIPATCAPTSPTTGIPAWSCGIT